MKLDKGIIWFAVILGIFYFLTQYTKNQSFENQKKMEILQEETQKVQELEAQNNMIKLRLACKEESEAKYWNYIHANGTLLDEEIGKYTAENRHWTKAEQIRDNHFEQCIKIISV